MTPLSGMRSERAERANLDLPIHWTVPVPGPSSAQQRAICNDEVLEQ